MREAIGVIVVPCPPQCIISMVLYAAAEVERRDFAPANGSYEVEQ